MDEMVDNSAPPDAQAEQPPAPDDARLVGRVLAGDETAFEELFNRHRRRVALIAGRFFRRREQIEEIIQESFTKAYLALPDFSNERETSFASWLARISFNTCYDELRRQKRRPESALSEVTEEESDWLQGRLRAETAGSDVESAAVARDLAQKLLARLSPEDRLLLVMLDVEGMSVGEIAELNGWSASKVKVRAHRARASLRKVL